MKKIVRLVPLVLLYIVIFYFSVKKTSDSPSLFPNIDKLQHFIAYFVLGFTISLSILNKHVLYWVLILSLIFGLSLEYIQGLLPYRDMSLADGIANTIGLISGTLFFNLFVKQIYKLLQLSKLDRIYN
ncbi:MAG: VanZ family protein [Spirochaetales bacterium]|nr:VanZ family protein [Spirochaetales bacterium]